MTGPVAILCPVNQGWAQFAGLTATGVIDCIDITTQADKLQQGTWFVVIDFEASIEPLGQNPAGQQESGHGPASHRADGHHVDGHHCDGQTAQQPRARARAWRFAHVGPSPSLPGLEESWRGPEADTWTSSLDQGQYMSAVRTTREAIRQGQVYQANICRVMSAPLTAQDAGGEPHAAALAAVLAAGNPAPYAAAIHVPASPSPISPVWVVSASPELYLSREADTVTSAPIKGTAPTAELMADKDHAENLMITDLVRNDLQRVCQPGTVDVTGLCRLEQHPGLVHLVSYVHGTLLPQLASSPHLWQEFLAATFPPGSVSGAPKASALDLIGQLETQDRGPYCGAIGWINGDTGQAQLAVGIRTFWWERDRLHFGTGAGITWGSDPAGEWEETQLKARRLISLASRPAASPVPEIHGGGLVSEA